MRISGEIRGNNPVLSQVPKCEAPGAPRFSGCDHFSRHLGHPPGVFEGLGEKKRPGAKAH